jgi:hypothetical protein
MRQEDLIGQWLPLSDRKPSSVIDHGTKWVGPMWSALNADWTIKVTPTKTEDTTEATVVFDLSACPMVMAEFAALVDVPVSELSLDMLPTKGPMIINHKCGLPYRPAAFNDGWREHYAKAGLPKGLWNRDTRAGGITEGTKSGASKTTVAGLPDTPARRPRTSTIETVWKCTAG